MHLSDWFFLYVVVQSLNCDWLFATPWAAASQASLSFTIFWSLLKFMSIESVMLSNHLILYCPLLLCLQYFPAARSFPVSWLFSSGGRIIGVSILASVLPVNVQGWFPLGLTGLIYLQSKGLSRVFSSTTVQKYQFFRAQPFYGPTLFIYPGAILVFLPGLAEIKMLYEQLQSNSLFNNRRSNR